MNSNKKWRLVFLVLALVLLSGCCTPTVVTKYKTKVITVPEDMLASCPIEPPPARELYMKANLSDRERLLVENNRTHVQNATICNMGKAEIRIWQQKQVELYSREEATVEK